MKHLGYLLIPLFMFADYLLTIAGSTLKEKVHCNHFKTKHYELNPIWHDNVKQKKWFSPKHTAITLIFSLFLIFCAESNYLSDKFAEGLLGCLLVSFGMINGRHLSNILSFLYINQHSDSVSGQVFMSHELVSRLSTYQYIGVYLPIMIIAIFSPSPFIYGALCSIVLNTKAHILWAKKYKKKNKSENNNLEN